MENTFPSAETILIQSLQSLPHFSPHFFSSLATIFFWEVWIQSRSHQIELDCHALIGAGDQLNGERINWIQARKPSPAVVWHWSVQLQEREEERAQGQGGGRERETANQWGWGWRKTTGSKMGIRPQNEEANSDAAGCLHRNRKRKLILKSQTVCLVCCKCFVIQNLTALWMTEDNFPAKRYWTARLKGGNVEMLSLKHSNIKNKQLKSSTGCDEITVLNSLLKHSPGWAPQSGLLAAWLTELTS